MTDGKQFWDKMAKTYDKNTEKKYLKTYQKTINSAKKYLSTDDRVLDFACGTGITVIPLSRFVNHIHAIDISNRMINEAKQKCAAEGIHNVTFSVGDLYGLDLKETDFHAVTAFNILCYTDETVLLRIRELLAEDGMLITATDCLGEKPSAASFLLKILSALHILPYIRFYDKAGLEDAIKRAGFEIIETGILHERPVNYFIAARNIKK